MYIFIYMCVYYIYECTFMFIYLHIATLEAKKYYYGLFSYSKDYTSHIREFQSNKN